MKKSLGKQNAKNPFTRPFGKPECKDNKKNNNLLYFDIKKIHYFLSIDAFLFLVFVQKLVTRHRANLSR